MNLSLSSSLRQLSSPSLVTDSFDEKEILFKNGWLFSLHVIHIFRYYSVSIAGAAEGRGGLVWGGRRAMLGVWRERRTGVAAPQAAPSPSLPESSRPKSRTQPSSAHGSSHTLSVVLNNGRQFSRIWIYIAYVLPPVSFTAILQLQIPVH